jgi:polysaccharide biosynthesis/export protein
MKNHLVTVIVLITLLTSCSSYKKNIYFQGIPRNSEEGYAIKNFSPPTIQPGDLLGINVKSLSSEGSAIFNTGSPSGGEKNAGSAATAAFGYLVDKNGDIQLPLVNNLKVSGYTLSEAQALIKKAIARLLKEPDVILTFMNFKVSVFGDVAAPSVFTVADERFSIPQALSLAGDLTATANRNNLLLIREVDGKRKFINIDMTSPKLFESPYYYLKNNDVLYVEPGKAKFASQNQVTKVIPLVLSAISIILATYQITK